MLNDLLYMVRDGGWVTWAQLATGMLGLLWALVCAVLLGLRWKVPVVLATAFLGLHALLVIVGVTTGSVDVSALSAVDPAQRAALVAFGISRVLTSAMFGVCVVPAAMLLGLGGMAGGIRAPRGYLAPGVVFLVCGLAALLPLGGIFVDASLPVTFTKVLLYGAGAIPVAASLLCAGQNTNGREASVAAAMAYFSLVASVEMADVARQWTQVFGALAAVDPEIRGPLLGRAAEEIATIARFGWASVGLAVLPIFIAAFRPSVPLTEEEIMTGQLNPSALRTVGTLLAFAVPLLWFAALLLSDPAPIMAKIATG